MQTPVLSLEDGSQVGLSSSGRSVSLLVERGLEVTSVTLSVAESMVLLTELERVVVKVTGPRSELATAPRSEWVTE